MSSTTVSDVYSGELKIVPREHESDLSRTLSLFDYGDFSDNMSWNPGNAFSPNFELSIQSPVPKVTNPPYTSLQNEGFGIQLLELSPGSFEDTIQIQLLTMDLDDVYLKFYPDKIPTYEALSYVWGVELASTEVLLNDIPVKVTSNLDSALRHLRRRLVSRVLWVDALSINQKDVQERNQQVRNMGNIYQRATSVIVWLGEVNPAEVHLRAMLGAMQFSCSGGHLRIDLFDYVCSIIALIGSNDLNEARDDAFQALHDLITRPWFSRVWVVQELALSNNANVMVGTYSFPWTQLEQFVRWLPHYKVDSAKHSGLIEAAGQVIKVPPYEPFHDQLHRTLHLSTTDPRDKIYGILGISVFKTSHIEPNYDKSTQRVFTEAVALILNDSGGYIYLYAPLYPQKEVFNLTRLPGLPSWVPDLRINEIRSRISKTVSMSVIDRRYHLTQSLLDNFTENIPLEPASNHHQCSRPSWTPDIPPVTALDFTTLLVTGIHIGTVIWTSGCFLEDIADFKETSVVQTLVQRLYCDANKIQDITPRDFVSVLLGPTAGHTKLVSEEYIEAARELISSPTPKIHVPWQIRRQVDELTTAITINAANRILVMVDGYHLGLSYHPNLKTGIRRGGVIGDLFHPTKYYSGSTFILRPLNDVYHEIINVSSILCCEQHLDENAEPVCGQDGDLDLDMETDTMAQVLEDNFGLPVPSELVTPITPEYLQDLKVQYSKHGFEFYAIK